MPPFRTDRPLAAAALIIALGLLTGCAFDAGEPWGRAHVELQASAPTSLRTADGITIELQQVELSTDAVLLFAGESSAAAAFDPADPPEGCTFCHSGHCHCGDDLIDYDALAAQIAGAGDDAAPAAVVPAEPAPVALSAEPQTVPVEGCDGGCTLPRGALRRVEVSLVGLRLVGEANGAPFDLDLAVPAAISAGTEVAFDRGEPVDATLALELSLPLELLDGIDPTAPAPDAATRLAQNLATFARLAVDIRRP